MKRIMLLTLLAFAVIGMAALVKAEQSCPPGQHMSSGRKYGSLCVANDPAAPGGPCVRHRVCKDGHCEMICR
jgi:hypothetical protein